MKQTIAELGIGGTGWIIYGDYFLPKRVVHIDVVNIWTEECLLMPEYLLREHIESNGVLTTRDLIVFANHTVYSTKEEADEEFIKVISSDAATHFRESEQLGKEISALSQPTLKGVDWKKLLSELGDIQKQFNEVTEDQKKDFCTFIKKLKNIADQQPDSTDWNQVRINAAISILNALLETTKHSVLGELAVKDIFAKAAVGYADRLVYELKRSEALFEEKLKEI